MSNNFEMHIDWNNDGDYADTGEDVTARTLNEGTPEVRRGRDLARDLAPSAPAILQFELNNASGDYTPENTGSPLFGDLVPGRPVRLRAIPTAETDLWLDLPGVNGNGASTPDTAALSIAGDIDVRAEVAPTWWSWAVGPTAMNIISKFGTGPDYSWAFLLQSDGALFFAWSIDGSATIIATSTVNMRVVDLDQGQRYWVRVTLDVNNGAAGYDVKFFHSADGSAWTQLGATVTDTPTTSIFDSAANVTVGWREDGGFPFQGRIYEAAVLEGIAGTERGSPDFTDTAQWTAGDEVGATGNDTQSNVWTLQGRGTIGIRNLFDGFIDDYIPDYALDSQRVAFTAVGGFARLEAVTLSTALSQGVSTGTAIDLVLDEAGIDGELRAIDSGATIIRFWWEEGTDGLEAIQKLVNSEGPGAIFYERGDGVLVFRDRHHRYLHTNAITSQATFDGDTPPDYESFIEDRGWRNIVNQVDAAFVTYSRASASTVVWAAGLAEGVRFSLGASATRSFKIVADRPYFSASISTDTHLDGEGLAAYEVVSGAVTPTFDRTDAQSSTITFTAGGGGAVVVFNYFVVVPLDATTRTVTDSDATSITTNGIKSFPLDAPWADENTVVPLAALIILQYKDPSPLASMTFYSSDVENTQSANALEREVTDRVTITGNRSHWNTDGYIHAITQRVHSAKLLETEIAVEKRVTESLTPAEIFILDSTSNGVLDTNKLGF